MLNSGLPGGGPGRLTALIVISEPGLIPPPRPRPPPVAAATRGAEVPPGPGILAAKVSYHNATDVAHARPPDHSENSNRRARTLQMRTLTARTLTARTLKVRALRARAQHAHIERAHTNYAHSKRAHIESMRTHIASSPTPLRGI